MTQEPYQFKSQKKKKKDKKLLLLLLILLLFLIGFGVFALLDHFNVLAENNNDMSEKVNDNTLLKRKKDDSYTEIIGHSKIVISEEEPYLELENLSSNKTSLIYEIRKDDKTIYKSKLLSPGQVEKYEVYKDVEEGQTALKYLISIYDLKGENLIHSGISLNQVVEVKSK